MECSAYCHGLKLACDLHEVCCVEELVEPFNVLQEPRARFEKVNEEAEKVFVSLDECALYSFEASATWSRKEIFKLVRGLSSNVIVALRILSKNLLKDNCNAIISSELYTMAAEIESKWSMRFD